MLLLDVLLVAVRNSELIRLRAVAVGAPLVLPLALRNQTQWNALYFIASRSSGSTYASQVVPLLQVDPQSVLAVVV